MTPAIAALFPGQGSQHVGMAKDLHENFKLVREIFEEASDAVRMDLRKLCFDGPESDLTADRKHAALPADRLGRRLSRGRAELGFKPAARRGALSGRVLGAGGGRRAPLATAAAWVRERGRAMQVAVPAGKARWPRCWDWRTRPSSRSAG